MGQWFRSIYFIKRSSRRDRLCTLSQAGQGTVEFVLVLVVSVALVLAVSSRIYKPFGEFAQSYMSDYVGCLLDRGILPKLGSEEDECSESLILSQGNPLAPRSGGGSSGGSSSSNSSSGKSPKNKEAQNSSEQDEMSSSRSGRTGRSIGRTQNTERGSRGGDAVGPKNDKVIEIPNPLGKSKYYKVVNVGSSGGPQGRVTRVEGLSGLLASERERIKRRENKISRIGEVESSEAQGRPKKLLLKPPVRKVAAVEDEEPWSFGRLIRFAIIILILIAIFVFLSGQIVQITKSWEK
jgi:hypothetical protein